MRFELASYKSSRSSEALEKFELTIEELEYIYGLVNREFIMNDALSGAPGAPGRKEKSLCNKMYEKLSKMIQPQKNYLTEEKTLSRK